MSGSRPARTSILVVVGAVGIGLIVLDSPLDVGRRMLAVALLAAASLWLLTTRQGNRRSAFALCVSLVCAPIAMGYGAVHVVEGSVLPAFVGIAAAMAWAIAV